MQLELDVLRALIIDSANAEILTRYQQIEGSAKEDGSLVTALTRRYPEIPFLGEEMSGAQQQALLERSLESEQGLWCLDPLDGTANFVAGMPCFAVSLAYLQGGESRLGIIYDPVREECFSAVAGEGAWLNGRRLQLSERVTVLEQCVAMVDLKRLPTTLACNLASRPPYRSQRSIGSVALDWCWLAAGRLQLYLHGGQRLWDYAAGQLIFAEAGGHLRLADGGGGDARYTQDLRPKVATGASG